MALPLVILAASQAGHLLAWQVRQGPQALPVAGSGAHGYFPALTVVTFGTAGVAVLAALCAIGAARAARLGRAVLRTAPGRQLRRIPVLDAAAFLFVLQFAVLLAQETAEAAWAGFSRPGLGDLMLWGILPGPGCNRGRRRVELAEYPLRGGRRRGEDPGAGCRALATAGRGAAAGLDATRPADAADPGAGGRVFRARTALKMRPGTRGG